MTISKEFKFDAAHMLSNYEGKCANLHGHTYHGTVSITGPVSDETRMLLDYNTIKKIIDMFDHAIIFSASLRRNEAEEQLAAWARRHGMRVYVMPNEYPRTTAEDMARVIASTLKHEEPVGVSWSVTVRLSETDGSWAEVTL